MADFDRAALQPSDGESRRALRALRLDDGKLPEQAIATPIGLSPFRLGLEVNTTTEPTACEWEPTAVVERAADHPAVDEGPWIEGGGGPRQDGKLVCSPLGHDLLDELTSTRL